MHAAKTASVNRSCWLPTSSSPIMMTLQNKSNVVSFQNKGGFSKGQDDDGKYDHEALKQWG